jgi:hypothetical protein
MRMIKRVAETVNPALARTRDWPTEALLGSRISVVCIVRPLRWHNKASALAWPERLRSRTSPPALPSEHVSSATFRPHGLSPRKHSSRCDMQTIRTILLTLPLLRTRQTGFVRYSAPRRWNFSPPALPPQVGLPSPAGPGCSHPGSPGAPSSATGAGVQSSECV